MVLLSFIFLVWMRNISRRSILFGILILILWLKWLNWWRVGLIEFGWFVVFMMMMCDCDFMLFIKVKSCETMRRSISSLVFSRFGVMELILLMKMIVGVFFLVFLNVLCKFDLDLLVSLDMILGLLIKKKKASVSLVIARVIKVFLLSGGL